jgi:hypothetical protein
MEGMLLPNSRRQRLGDMGIIVRSNVEEIPSKFRLFEFDFNIILF